VTVVLALLAVVALSGAKVAALWPQPEAGTDSSLVPSLRLPRIDAGLVTTTGEGDAQRPVLARLEQRLAADPDDYEASLLKGLFLFQQGRLQDAIAELRALTARAPKFQLAHLVLGDLLLARYGRLAPLAAQGLAENRRADHQEQIERLQKEAMARLQGYLSLVGAATVPDLLLTLGADVSHAIVVDKSKNRLYVFRNAGAGLPPQLVTDFYVVLGKEKGQKQREGDLRTPDGAYFVTGHFTDEQLPALYGSGAFPVNYPNELDRHQHKSGQGIWLHGTDKELYSRPPLDSEGCVVLTNEEFSKIVPYVEAGRTPVIISEKVRWLTRQQWLAANIELQSVLEGWRRQWEAADFASYIDFYANDFWSGDFNRRSWGTYKQGVFAGKSFQQLALSDLSLFGSPQQLNGAQVVVANFKQHYRSNNYNGDMRKRLYLIREQGDWKILYEGEQ